MRIFETRTSGEFKMINPVGYVVRVMGDIVLVGVDKEGLREIGRRGTYVRIDTDVGDSLIGIVSNLNLTDELYRQSGGRLDLFRGFEDLSIVRSELIVSLLGTIIDGKVDRKLLSTPTPGNRVYKLDSETLSSIFSGNDIEIGSLNTQPDVRVSLKLNEIATKHLAVLAMTGSGKSNALGVLLLNVLTRYEYPRIVLIDTHSEYIPMKNIDGIKDKVNIYSPRGKIREALIDRGIEVKDLEIPYWLLSIEEWYSILSLEPRATRQRRAFRTALRHVKEMVVENASLNDPIYFDLKDLRDTLDSMRDGEEVLMKLEDAYENEEYEFIFFPENSIKLKDSSEKLFEHVTRPILSTGLNIISLGGLSSEIQNAVASMLLRFLFKVSVESKLKGKPLPVLLAIEEAHVYAPESYTYVAARDIIEKIAKEGRKFGIGLIIISQRPRELSQTLLAQCGTLFALRTVNPSDQTHIQRSMEDVTQSVLSSLPSLGKGEAVISGPAVPIPCIVKIDLFEELAEKLYASRVQLGGKDIDFNEAWSKELTIVELREILSGLYTPRGRSRPKYEKERKESRLDEFFSGD